MPTKHNMSLGETVTSIIIEVIYCTKLNEVNLSAFAVLYIMKPNDQNEEDSTRCFPRGLCLSV